MLASYIFTKSNLNMRALLNSILLSDVIIRNQTFLLVAFKFVVNRNLD